MLKKRWDGFMVCSEDWETRHVSDFIKGSKPVPPLPFTRPEGVDVYVGPDYDSTTPTIYLAPVIVITEAGSVTFPPAVQPPSTLPPTYPVNPTLVPVYVDTVFPGGTITIPTDWPPDTIFEITNPDGGEPPYSIYNPGNYSIIEKPYYPSGSSWVFAMSAVDVGSLTYGYGLEPVEGTLLPTEFKTLVIRNLNSDSVGIYTSLDIEGQVLQTAITSITVGAVTLLSTAAIFESSTEVSSWTWYGTTLFSGVGSYSITISGPG